MKTEWMFVKTDRLGRILLTGTVSATSERNALGVADFYYGDDNNPWSITILGQSGDLWLRPDEVLEETS